MVNKSAAFRSRVISVFHDLKHNKPCEVSPIVAIYQDNLVVAYLRVVSRASIQNAGEIALFAKWRKASQRWFPGHFRVTIVGTKKWAVEQVIEKSDRILFMIQDLSGTSVGHVGLNRFDFEAQTCEVDNIIRGEEGIPGLMTAAIETLMSWGKTELGVKNYLLQCKADNTKAMALYTRSGFKKVKDLPEGMIRMKKQ